MTGTMREDECGMDENVEIAVEPIGADAKKERNK